MATTIRERLSGNIGSGSFSVTLSTFRMKEPWLDLETPGYFNEDIFNIGDMFYVYNETTNTGRIYFIDGVVGDKSSFYAKKAYGA